MSPDIKSAVANFRGIGTSLAVLGVEEQFLSTNGLKDYTVPEKAWIVEGIVDGELSSGRWQRVVELVYGESSQVKMLYDLDRTALRERIMHAVGTNREESSIKSSTLDTLVAAGESDLIFTLAASAPNVNYESFNDMVAKVGTTYFEDPQEGAQRTAKLHSVAAGKAFTEKNYSAAFDHFKTAGDKDGISRVFDAILSNSPRDSKDLVEKIALSDPEKKDVRLGILVRTFSDKQKGLKPLDAYVIRNQHTVHLETQEILQLEEAVAEITGVHQLDPLPLELKVKWAERHVNSQPRKAYDILKGQMGEDDAIVSAVVFGLSLDPFSNAERALKAGEIKTDYLRMAYATAPFEIQVKIATELDDKEELKKLGEGARARGNKELAYRLWVAGGEDLNKEEVVATRGMLINEGIAQHNGNMFFMRDSDTPGMAQAYDALMKSMGDKSAKVSKARLLNEAYEFALKLGDESRLETTRQKMVALSPAWALYHFARKREPGGVDQRGIDYVVSAVADKNGVNAQFLNQLVGKYSIKD